MPKTPFEFTHEGITYIQNNRAKYCSACAAVEVCDATRHNERRNNLCGPDGLIYSIKPTTPKTKETKSMTENKTTKKPGTSHGKPTAKGLRVQPKTAKATVKPKYPAPREALTYGVTVTGKSTKESIIGLLEMTIEIHNGTLKDLATTGTKLDRALVDLKEAKAKIKELSKALEAAK